MAVLSDRIHELEAALEEVSRAAVTQLSGRGKGIEPSERLQTALDEASRLLGRNVLEVPVTDEDRELAELRERYYKR